MVGEREAVIGMDGLITLIAAGFAVIGVLLALVPTVGAVFPDPRPFTPEEVVRRTRVNGILIASFAFAILVLNLIRPVLWP